MADTPATLSRLILIGLDGGSWPLLKSLAAAGVMENLAELLAQGPHAELMSVLPPVTGPAWPSAATGLNPGRLGTFDFYNRRSLNDYTLYPVRSPQLQRRAFWDIMSQKGYRIGLFGYPMLLPAYEINGWMTAGIGASKLQPWVWPPELATELDQIAAPFQISISYGLPRYRNHLERLLADMGDMMEGQLRALTHLLRSRPVDILVAVFGLTDVLSHVAWHLWDTSHPLHNPDLAAALMPKVHALWRRVDATIGQLRQFLDPEGHLLLLSDHGFGPNYGVFHTNVWLEKSGFLRRHPGPGRLHNQFRGRLVDWLAPVAGPLMRQLQGSRLHFALRASLLREIDLSRTKAFALETTDICGMVFINRQFARQRGLDEAHFVAQTAAEIRQQLQHYAQQHHLRVDIFFASDLYHGALGHLAPELLFVVDDFEVSVSYKFAPAIYEKRPHHPMKTGNHRREGIFLLAGPKAAAAGQISPLHLTDVAPTVFQLVGEPLPEGLDGQVASQSLAPAHRRPVRYCMIADRVANVDDNLHLEKADSELMRRQLRELGYLD